MTSFSLIRDILKMEPHASYTMVNKDIEVICPAK